MRRTARAQVEAAIAEFSPEGVVDLELVLAPGEALPTELVALTELCSLRLVCPGPLQLPKWFVRLRGLITVEIDAELDALPANLGELDSLEELRVRRCRGGFAPVLAELPHLRELELELDELGEVPLALAERPALDCVSIRAARLARVPLGFLVAPMLRCLTLNFDQAPLPPAMPRVIPGLRQLELLALSGWPLTTIPPVLTELGALTSLTLRRCDLVELPASLEAWGALLGLRHLDVSDNRLTQLPAVLADLPALASVVASDNPLATVDPALRQLRRLEL